MKVYVVILGEYMEGYGIIGIFHSKEMAEAKRASSELEEQATTENDVIDYCRVMEWEVI